MASLASYDLCQTICNDAAGICYASAAGFVFGAVTAGVGAPAVDIETRALGLFPAAFGWARTRVAR